MRNRSLWILATLWMATLLMTAIGCAKVVPIRMVGIDDAVPEMKISPAEAIALARPHLQASFEQLKKHSEEVANSDRTPWETILVDGDWYVVAYNNYPFMNANDYRYGAVRVHGQTGEVVLPDFDRKSGRSS